MAISVQTSAIRVSASWLTAERLMIDHKFCERGVPVWRELGTLTSCLKFSGASIVVGLGPGSGWRNSRKPRARIVEGLAGSLRAGRQKE